jgi:hypothetical protein
LAHPEPYRSSSGKEADIKRYPVPGESKNKDKNRYDFDKRWKFEQHINGALNKNIL